MNYMVYSPGQVPALQKSNGKYEKISSSLKSLRLKKLTKINNCDITKESFSLV